MRCEILNIFFKIITTLGNAGVIWILLTIAMILLPKYRKAGWTSAISLLLSVIIVNLLVKNLVARVRPYEVIDGLNLIVGKAGDWSFPSGHTSSSFAAALSILLSGHKWEGVGAMILAALIGFSRLYVGIHYPSDVLCGALFGIVCAIVAGLIMKKLGKFNLMVRFTKKY